MTDGVAPAGALAVADARLGPPRTLLRDVISRFIRHRLAVTGLFLTLMLCLAIVVLPLFYTASPEYIDIALANQTPSWKFPMGTDDLGRDTLARNLYGGRISLAVGLVAMFVSILLGTLIGLLSGYFRRLDNPLMRFTDMMLALPSLPLLMVIIMLFRDVMRRALGS